MTTSPVASSASSPRQGFADASNAPVIERLSEKVVYENRYIRVFNDPVRFPTGQFGQYTRVKVGTHDGVATLPVRIESVTGVLQVCLVRQYRYALSTTTWEVPRGCAHSDDAAAEAARELSEEACLTSTRMIDLGVMHPDSGMLESTVRLFLAVCDSDAEAGVNTEDGEVDASVWVNLDDAMALVASGELTDSFTTVALARAMLRGLLTPTAISLAASTAH